MNASVYLTIWIALDAATDANGPIFYLKGSHRSGTLPHRPSGVAGNSMGLSAMPPHDDADFFRGTLAAGDALIHHCETIHWSARNQTDQPRCGYYDFLSWERAFQEDEDFIPLEKG